MDGLSLESFGDGDPGESWVGKSKGQWCEPRGTGGSRTLHPFAVRN